MVRRLIVAMCAFLPWAVTGCRGPSGPVAVPHALQSIAALRPDLRTCYNGGVQSGPAGGGSVRFDLRVDAEGYVVSATPSDGSLPAFVVHCLTVVFEGARFEPPGAEATLHIPVKFVPRE